MADFSNFDPKVVSLFKKFDTNSNNTLEKTELAKGLGELISGLEPNMDENKLKDLTDEVIKLFDLNQNGQLEIDEFNNLIHFLVEEKGLDLG